MATAIPAPAGSKRAFRFWGWGWGILMVGFCGLQSCAPIKVEHHVTAPATAPAAPPATPYRVTVAVAELAGTSGMPFQVRRTNATLTNSAVGSVMMSDGAVTVGVAPLELVTLRSVGAR